MILNADCHDRQELSIKKKKLSQQNIWLSELSLLDSEIQKM